MKVFVQLIIVGSLSLFVYKKRYRLLNWMMSIGFLRKYAVRISMNIPSMRAKILPSLFDSEVEQELL
ncbi:hypothetical protein [Oceanobacillus senegalensis]|uniref:hypothetical protein n=1 Tax=Oceanobacillus senegalensis TaxID=1936063 RepID=UPI000A311B26|nr:hypothetical protein [Oceanobacillus senegalensis]